MAITSRSIATEVKNSWDSQMCQEDWLVQKHVWSLWIAAIFPSAGVQALGRAMSSAADFYCG